YQIHSSTNAITGVLPGVSIALHSTSSSPVTITVAADGTKAAGAVTSFVNAANAVLGSINSDLAYNAQTGQAGPLNGDVSLEQLAQSILNTVGTAIGTSGLSDGATAGSAAGLSLSSSGTLSFNATTFAADFAANPTKVAALFSQGGQFTPSGGSSGSVSLVFAQDATQPGNYAVSVSQSASQAADTGSATFSSATTTLSGGDTYTIGTSAGQVNYAVGAGESLSSVAAGLDAAFASAGLGLSAQVVGAAGSSSLQVTSSAYGSSQSFTVSASGTDELGLASASAFTGADVAGTINGVAATGSGQFLSAPGTDPVLAGLTLQVTSTGISTPTAIGTYNYAPGLAQGLATLALQSNASPSGLLPARITQLHNTSTGLGSEIAFEQQVVNEQQAALQQEFTNLESTLATLKGQSSFLANAFGGSSSTGSTGSSSGSSTSGSSSGSSTTTGG
ncbi:MAG: flagellar hook-associated 2 domain protein, partial [Acidimicrobiaceae bacterium]|nr:flagellar hook-associated 2 domain protein [Acidimicrobiaceae bacterium]